MSLPDTSTLERGRYNVAFTFDNRTANPLRWTYWTFRGLGRRLGPGSRPTVTRW